MGTTLVKNKSNLRWKITMSILQHSYHRHTILLQKFDKPGIL